MDWSILLNPVLLAVVVLLVLAALRLNVVFALVIAAGVGGILGAVFLAGGGDTLTGLQLLAERPLSSNLEFLVGAFKSTLGSSGSFMTNLDYGAGLAMQYVMLGTFAIALNRSGLTELIARCLFHWVGRNVGRGSVATVKYGLIGILTLIAISSQNLIPMHIAFIPVLIPPLLGVFEKLRMDRRLIACVLTFGLITPYMVCPVGFGKIYMHKILVGTINAAGGVTVTPEQTPAAMLIPALGMFAGYLIAVFFSYRKPRDYAIPVTEAVQQGILEEPVAIKPFNIAIGIVAVVTTLLIQIFLDSLIFGSLLAVLVFIAARIISVRDTQDLFVKGVALMGGIGVVMIAAAGFASVMKATKGVDQLVAVVAGMAGTLGADVSAMLLFKGCAIFLMLLVGLIVTMGIGSSFSTVPLLATIYVPICVTLGLSPLAIIAVIGSAGALGDAGSPVSESVLGPTAGLNADGQHDHIYDSTIPTFLHYNLPLLAAGWIAGMVL